MKSPGQYLIASVAWGYYAGCQGDTLAESFALFLAGALALVCLFKSER